MRHWFGQLPIEVPSVQARWATANELERENRELRQANEILRKGETLFRHWSKDNGRTRILLRRSATARFAIDCLH